MYPGYPDGCAGCLSDTTYKPVCEASFCDHEVKLAMGGEVNFVPPPCFLYRELLMKYTGQRRVKMTSPPMHGYAA
jgi:hypothetical protein